MINNYCNYGRCPYLTWEPAARVYRACLWLVSFGCYSNWMTMINDVYVMVVRPFRSRGCRCAETTTRAIRAGGRCSAAQTHAARCCANLLRVRWSLCLQTWRRRRRRRPLHSVKNKKLICGSVHAKNWFQFNVHVLVWPLYLTIHVVKNIR